MSSERPSDIGQPLLNTGRTQPAVSTKYQCGFKTTLGGFLTPKVNILKHFVEKIAKCLGRLGDAAESLDDFTTKSLLLAAVKKNGP